MGLVSPQESNTGVHFLSCKDYSNDVVQDVPLKTGKPEMPSFAPGLFWTGFCEKWQAGGKLWKIISY